jgi:signal transduction histidine kinase
MGLHIMKYRADVIGGRLSIESDEGKGTLVSCVLPVKSRRSEPVTAH